MKVDENNFHCPGCSETRSVGTSLVFADDVSYRRCKFCGLLSLSPMPTSAAINALYSSKYYDSSDLETGYSDYSILAKARIRTFKRYAARLACEYPGGRVLDIGCATGYFISAAEGENLRVEGIDISQSAISKIKPIFGERVHCSSVEELAAERPKAYDILFLSDIIEHVPDPRAFVRALAALVRPGGKLLCITPNERGLLARISGRRWVSIKIPEHVVLYNPLTLTNLLDTEFEVDSIRPAFQEYPSRLISQRLGQINYFLGMAARVLGLARNDISLRIPDGNMIVHARRRLS